LSTETEIGDTVVLTTAAGSIKFVIDSVSTYEKASLRQAEIWDIVPNRLIIISCYTEDPWGKNVVVSASPSGS
jgi:sortase (surface protein transpeptidase)